MGGFDIKDETFDIIFTSKKMKVYKRARNMAAIFTVASVAGLIGTAIQSPENAGLISGFGIITLLTLPELYSLNSEYKMCRKELDDKYPKKEAYIKKHK